MASIEEDIVLDEAVDALQRLGLHRIDDNWTNTVWDSQFTESPRLPHGFECYTENEVNVIELLDQVRALLDVVEVAYQFIRFKFIGMQHRS
jgi:hypothetical protein